MQQGMLYMSISATPGAGYYIEQAVCAIAHPLDEAAFAAAWREVFRHYPVFATEFSWERLARAEQRVRPDVELPFAVNDLSATAPEERAARLDAFLAEDRQRGFALNEAPLTRVSLLRWTPESYHCVWTVHHTIADGRAMAYVLRQVFALYDARQAGGDHALPDLPPFRDYAEAVSAEPSDEAAAFWKTYLDGYSEPAALPLPAPAETPETPGIGAEALVLPEALVPALESLAADTGSTLGTIVQAAWAVVISRYSQKSDVAFGVTKAVRHLPSAPPDAVGMYINTLPLRVNVDDDAPLRDWLGQVRERWTALRPREQDALSRIQAWSPLRGGTPLFNSVLVFENGSIDRLVKSRGGDWSGRAFKLHERTPGALTLAVYAGERIELTAEYDDALYRAPDIARLLRHIGAVLAGMATAPDAAVGSLPLLSDAERRVLLIERQPPPFAPPEGSVMEWFAKAAAANLGKPALMHDGQVLSYAELDARARAFADSLRALGAGPGKFVGLSAPRSIEVMVGLLGILRAGAAYVPIDPAYPEERLNYLCEDAGITLMATVRSLAGVWEDRVARVLYLDEPDSWPAGAPGEAATAPEDPAYVIYTSGTTGKPKGVVVHHAALAAFASGAFAAYGMRADDRMLQFSSLSFDAAVEEIFLSLCHGLTLVLRTDAMLASPPVFYEACEAAGVTMLDMPTAFWNILAGEMARSKPPACVRGALIGGEAVRPDALAQWRAGVPEGVTLINTYGPTEATVVAAAAVLDHEDAAEVPIGRPLPGATTYVLDARLRLVPDGLPGELYIGGPQVALGYHGRPDLTAERFLPNPFGEGRLYKSGDRVRYRDDGQLVYLGRQDRQIKLRGFRVELDEVEAFLRSCGGVKDAAVTVHESAPGVQRMAGYVVPEDPAALETIAEACRAEAAERMPEYMRPSVLVALERLPLNNSGKVDYKALPAPESSDADVDEDDAPRGDTEWRMAKLWGKVLGLRHVGRNDNFFEIGGHSLQGVILLSHIERRFGRRLPPLRLYQAPTVAALSRIVDEEEGAPPRVALHPIQPKGSRVPMFFVGSTDLLPAIKDTLGPDQPLFSLNIFGLQEDDGGYTFKNVADIAAMFIEEVRACQPHGPYALGGYCRDTMVAYEMARQLTAAGDEVRLVAMVDIFWDTGHTYGTWQRHWRNFQMMGLGYLAAKWKEKVKTTREAITRFTSRRAKERAGGQAAALPMQHRHALFVNAYYDSILDYEPQPYDGSITVYMATEWGLRDTPRWKQLCAGGVAIREVEACHFNIWHSPQAERLGAAMRDDLIAVSGDSCA